MINHILAKEAILKERSKEIFLSLPENTEEEIIELLNMICKTPLDWTSDKIASSLKELFQRF